MCVYVYIYIYTAGKLLLRGTSLCGSIYIHIDTYIHICICVYVYIFGLFIVCVCVYTGEAVAERNVLARHIPLYTQHIPLYTHSTFPM